MTQDLLVYSREMDAMGYIWIYENIYYRNFLSIYKETQKSQIYYLYKFKNLQSHCCNSVCTQRTKNLAMFQVKKRHFVVLFPFCFFISDLMKFSEAHPLRMKICSQSDNKSLLSLRLKYESLLETS
jgi:hypothetical protein